MKTKKFFISLLILVSIFSLVVLHNVEFDISIIELIAGDGGGKCDGGPVT